MINLRSALLIWSALPLVVAGGLYFLRRYDRVVHLAAIAVCLALAWLAWTAPIGAPIIIRLWREFPAFEIQPAMQILGGSFSLGNNLRPALALLYLSAAFWFGGSYTARTHRLFTPTGLAIAGLMSAALGAGAISTAALLTALVALLCVPVLSAPGEPLRRGILRFLVYQLSGVCLVLFAESALAATQSPESALGPFFTLLLGFALMMGVVPFHTWMPMLAEVGRPFSAAFVFFVIPASAGLLALQIILRLGSSSILPALPIVLRFGGVLMLATGGIGAALERNLGRLAGFAAMTQVGGALLAISLVENNTTANIGLVFAELAPQGLALALLGLSLGILRSRSGSLDAPALTGAGRRLPAATFTALLSLFSMAGLPLLAAFPIYTAILQQVGRHSLSTAFLSLAGLLALTTGVLRNLAGLFSLPLSSVPLSPAPKLPAWRWEETRLQIALLGLGAALLFIVGLFPQVYLPTIAAMALQFAAP